MCLFFVTRLKATVPSSVKNKNSRCLPLPRCSQWKTAQKRVHGPVGPAPCGAPLQPMSILMAIASCDEGGRQAMVERATMELSKKGAAMHAVQC